MQSSSKERIGIIAEKLNAVCSGPFYPAFQYQRVDPCSSVKINLNLCVVLLDSRLQIIFFHSQVICQVRDQIWPDEETIWSDKKIQVKEQN